MGCAAMTGKVKAIGGKLGCSTVLTLPVNINEISPPIKKELSDINLYAEKNVDAADLNPYDINQATFIMQCANRMVDIRGMGYGDKSNCLTILYNMLSNNATFIRNFRAIQSWAESESLRLSFDWLQTFEPMFFAIYIESMIMGCEYVWKTYGWEALPPSLKFDFMDEFGNDITFVSDQKTIHSSSRWTLNTIYNIQKDKFVKFGYITHAPNVYIHAVYAITLFMIEESYKFHREELTKKRNIFQKVLHYGERGTDSMEIDDMYLRVLMDLPHIRLVSRQGNVISPDDIYHAQQKERKVDSASWLAKLKLDQTFKRLFDLIPNTKDHDHAASG